MIKRWLVAFCLTMATCVFCAVRPAPAATAPQQLWLVVSDIHLDLLSTGSLPSSDGFDTNRPLLDAAIRHMKRDAPNATLILLPGDLLMHDFENQSRRHSLMPYQAAVRTMGWIAGRFRRAFPSAQFAIALGNNDAPCGDYKSANGSDYLETVARIWAPLVDRGGASPDFESDFSRGGYYVARVPVRGLRLVVLNTTPLSSQYGGNCSGSTWAYVSQQLTWLTKTLSATPPGSRNLVMMHIPPGFDAFSTNYLHDIVAWRFLSARYDGALVDALVRPEDRVAYAIAGHTHRFDFRFAGRLPVFVFGALSPIYANNPSYYVLRIGPEGSVRDIGIRVFDEADQRWIDFEDFDRAWKVHAVDDAALERLHDRLAENAALRDAWHRQSGGWASGADSDDRTWGARWRVSWCAQDLLVRDFARCARIRRRLLTLPLMLAGGLTVLAALGAFALSRRRRRVRID